MADLENFIPAIKYGHTGGRLLTNTVTGDLAFDANGTATFSQGIPFISTVSVGTVACASGSGVTLLSSTIVSQNRKAYITGFTLTNSGGAWGSAGFYIQDQVGTDKYFIFTSAAPDFAIPATTMSPYTTGTVVTGRFFKEGVGGATSSPVYFKSDGTTIVNASLGTATVTIWGFVK